MRSSMIAEGKRFVRTALGVHPELAGQRYGELVLLTDPLGETRYVGEVGLDFATEDKRDRELQRKAFGAILEGCADYGDKVITVHSRRAAGEVVGMVGVSYPGTVILHWFSGSFGALERAVDHGFFFSVNPAMLASERGRRLVSRMPLDRLLTETEGLFVMVGSSSARPRDVARVISGLSELRDLAPERLAELLFGKLRVALAAEGKGERRDPDTAASQGTRP